MYQDPPLASPRGTLDRTFQLDYAGLSQRMRHPRPNPSPIAPCVDGVRLRIGRSYSTAFLMSRPTSVSEKLATISFLRPAIDELANQMRRYFAAMSVDKECHFKDEIPVGARPFVCSWPGWR